MKIALILTTYNWVDALELSLSSALKQSVSADEIIIADDGSTIETKDLITKIASQSNVNIIHSWQEDNGFRLAKSRNLAILKTTADYIICVDGDIILDEHFVQDHLNCANNGFYVQGSRVILKSEISKRILKNKHFQKPLIFSKMIKNNLNGIRSKFLSSIVCHKQQQTYMGIKGCNFAFFKQDFLAVNGFNEDFITWGREDSEFIARLYHIGIKRKNLKFAGIQYHLYHKEGNSNSLNDGILSNTIDKKLTWCKNGIK